MYDINKFARAMLSLGKHQDSIDREFYEKLQQVSHPDAAYLSPEGHKYNELRTIMALFKKSGVNSGYKPLEKVFELAYEQAASGKGKERHGMTEDFLSQPIMYLTESVGVGFPIGQACKKAMEAVKLLEIKGKGAAQSELLGAINYLAAAYIYIDGKKVGASDYEIALEAAFKDYEKDLVLDNLKEALDKEVAKETLDKEASNEEEK